MRILDKITAFFFDSHARSVPLWILAVLFLLLWVTAGLSQIMQGFIVALVSGIAAYWAGLAKAFRDAKQKAYSESLAPIIKMVYDKEIADKKEFNKAVALVWLYGSKNVALKMNDVASIINDPKRGKGTEALQQLIVEMRKDIQLREDLKPDEVKHLYTVLLEKWRGRQLDHSQYLRINDLILRRIRF